MTVTPPRTRPLCRDAQCQIVVERASRALGKIKQDPANGATNVSHKEIEAMAAMLHAYGMYPIMPGQETPAPLRVVVADGWIAT